MWDDADTHYQVQSSAGSKSPSLRWNPAPDLWHHGPAGNGIHEIKHDGYRLMVRRDDQRIRCFTRNGDDWVEVAVRRIRS